jgi:signal transduction histidine kinase
MQLLANLLRWVDPWVPDGLEADQRRMGRATVGMALLLAPWAPIIGGGVMAAGAHLAGGAILFTGVVCLFLPALMHRTGAVVPLAHLFVLSLVQGLVISGTLLGGVCSPPTAWLALVPVVATATGGVRTGSIWTGLAVLCVLLIGGLQVQAVVPIPYLEGEWLVIGTVSSIGLLLLVGVFLRANDLVYQQLIARTRSAEEREREANRAKSSFLANMSHEIRTPLNAILGYTELVREDAEALGQTGMTADLDRVHRSSTHLLDLVNDILDLSKIEAGHLDVQRERIDLAALATAVCEEMTPLVEARGNRLVLETAPVFAEADPSRTRQCMLNLLSNAAKFTENGTVTLTLRHAAEHVIIEVRDTGIGMSPDEVARIFDPFAQASAETSRKYGGTGLGMSIAKRLTELMGGSLDVDSAPGTGSTFRLVLPRPSQA